MAQEFDKVTLRDGTTGDIVEVLEPGVAYLFLHDPPYTPDGGEVVTIYEEDIVKAEKMRTYRG